MEPDPPPAELALARLEKLTLAGAPPDRVIQFLASLIAAWADEPEITPAAAHLRIEHMWDAVTRNATDLQEQIADHPGTDKPALTAAKRTLTALQAAEATLANALARL